MEILSLKQKSYPDVLEYKSRRGRSMLCIMRKSERSHINLDESAQAIQNFKSRGDRESVLSITT